MSNKYIGWANLMSIKCINLYYKINVYDLFSEFSYSPAQQCIYRERLIHVTHESFLAWSSKGVPSVLGMFLAIVGSRCHALCVQPACSHVSQQFVSSVRLHVSSIIIFARFLISLLTHAPPFVFESQSKIQPSQL